MSKPKSAPRHDVPPSKNTDGSQHHDDKASLESYVIPLMREYIRSYGATLNESGEADGGGLLVDGDVSSITVEDRLLHEAASAMKDDDATGMRDDTGTRHSPRLHTDPRRWGAPSAAASQHPTILGRQNPGTGRQTQSPASIRHAAAPPASVVHRTAQMIKWVETFPITATSSSSSQAHLSVARWAPLLLKELNGIVPIDAPKPHSLRTEAAMHVVRACFAAFQIPLAFLQDLEASVYAAQEGFTSLAHSDRRRSDDSACHGTVITTPVPRRFMFEAFSDALIQRQVLAARATEFLATKDKIAVELKATLAASRTSTLRAHFSNWRTFVRQTSTYRHAAELHRTAKTSFAWKRITFYAWRSMVSVSKAESALDHLQLEVIAAAERHRAELATQGALMRKQMDAERRAHDEVLAVARANEFTPEERQVHEERLALVRRLETEDAELRKHCQFVEAKVKGLTVFKEESTAVLKSVVDRVSQSLLSMMSYAVHGVAMHRTLGGVKACDVVSAALRASGQDSVQTGHAARARAPSNTTGGGAGAEALSPATGGAQTSSALDVVTLPVACRGVSILLGWVQLVMQSGRLPDDVMPAGGSSAPLAITPEWSDCRLYVAIWKVIDQDADEARAVSNAANMDDTLAQRAERFLEKFSLYLLRRWGKPLTVLGGGSNNAAAGGRRGSTAFGVGSSGMDGSDFRWSPLLLSDISLDAFLRGSPLSHQVVLLLLMKLFHETFIPSSIVDAIPAQSYLHRCVFRKPTTNGPQHPSHSSVMREVQLFTGTLEQLDDFADACQQVSSALLLTERSDKSWSALLDHVYHDIVGEAVRQASRAQRSSADMSLTSTQISSVAGGVVAPISDQRLPLFTPKGAFFDVVRQRRAAVAAYREQQRLLREKQDAIQQANLVRLSTADETRAAQDRRRRLSLAFTFGDEDGVDDVDSEDGDDKEAPGKGTYGGEGDASNPLGGSEPNSPSSGTGNSSASFSPKSSSSSNNGSFRGAKTAGASLIPESAYPPSLCDLESDLVRIMDLCIELVPSINRRQDLFQRLEMLSPLIADMFCFYSGGTHRLRAPQFQRLWADCGIPAMESLGPPLTSTALGVDDDDKADAVLRRPSSRADVATTSLSRDALFDKYATAIPATTGGSSGKGLMPLALSLLLIELALFVGVRLKEWRVLLDGNMTPATLVQTFVFRFFFCRNPKPVFSDVAFRGVPYGLLLPLGLGGKSLYYGSQSELMLSANGLLLSAPAISGKTAAVAPNPPTGSLIEGNLLVLLFELMGAVAAGNTTAAKSKASATTSLSVEDFVRLWKEVDVLEANCTKFVTGDARTVFQMLTQGRCFIAAPSAPSGPAAPGSRGAAGKNLLGATLAGLTLEWDPIRCLESLALVACYKYPSPFFSYHGRLRALLTDRVLPALQKRFPSSSPQLCLV